MKDGSFSPDTIPENIYGYRNRLRFIFDSLQTLATSRGVTAQNIRILDIGCGTGSYITVPLAQAGYSIVGLDPDADSIRVAKAATTDTRARFSTDLIEDFQSDKPFDVIILAEVVEHIIEPIPFIQAALAHLAANGVVIITLPNGYGWFELDDWLWKHAGVGQLRNGLVWSANQLLGMIGATSRLIRGWFGQVVPKPTAHLTSTAIMGTLNDHSPHVQHFRVKSLHRLIDALGLEVVVWRPSIPFAGKIVDGLFGWSRVLVSLNVWLGKYLPRPLASGWYLVLQRQGQEKQ